MPAQQTTEAARSEARAVQGTVKEEAAHVAEQAREQARTTAHRVQDDLRRRGDEEARRVAQTLRETSDRLRSMAEHTGEQDGFLHGLVREGADATDRLASRLDDGGLEALTADVRSWARRRPGAFLLGAAATGFVIGRLVRNLGGEQDGSRSGQGLEQPQYAGHGSTWPAAEPYTGTEPPEHAQTAGGAGTPDFGTGRYSTAAAAPSQQERSR